eukprot:scaffold22727_cov58-Phaeocystis_antarctica.AAC.10
MPLAAPLADPPPSSRLRPPPTSVAYTVGTCTIALDHTRVPIVAARVRTILLLNQISRAGRGGGGR